MKTVVTLFITSALAFALGWLWRDTQGRQYAKYMIKSDMPDGVIVDLTKASTAKIMMGARA